MDSNHRMSESKSDALPTWRRGYIKQDRIFTVLIKSQMYKCCCYYPKLGGEYWNRTNQLRFAVHILTQNTVLHLEAYSP